MRPIAELAAICDALEPESIVLYRQPHKLSKLLTALAEGCDIDTAMRSIGSTYATYHNWKAWADERRPEWSAVIACINEAIGLADRELVASVTRHTKDDGHLGLKVIKSKPSLKEQWGERPQVDDERVIINIGVINPAAPVDIQLEPRHVPGLVVNQASESALLDGSERVLVHQTAAGANESASPMKRPRKSRATKPYSPTT